MEKEFSQKKKGCFRKVVSTNCGFHVTFLMDSRGQQQLHFLCQLWNLQIKCTIPTRSGFKSCKFRHTGLALNGITSYWHWKRAPNMKGHWQEVICATYKEPHICKAVSWASFTASVHTHSTKPIHGKKLNYEEAISSLPNSPGHTLS